MTRKHLAEYFGTHYHSGNMIISVAGNLDPAYVMGVLENTLVPVQNSGSKTPTDPAVFQGGLVLENRNLHQVRLSMCFQSSKASDVHNYASEIVLGQILGGGMASRLFQEVREKRGLAYSVGADARAFMDLSTMTIGAGVNPEKIGEALGAIQEVIMGADKISDEDVLRAKNMLLTDLATSRETVDSHAQAGFSDFMEHGHVIATEKKITALRAVTAPDVSNAAIRVFSTTPSLAAIGPAANLKEVERAHSTLGM
jgi:predicted Zn-dependent peptidase